MYSDSEKKEYFIFDIVIEMNIIMFLEVRQLGLVWTRSLDGWKCGQGDPTNALDVGCEKEFSTYDNISSISLTDTLLVSSAVMRQLTLLWC